MTQFEPNGVAVAFVLYHPSLRPAWPFPPASVAVPMYTLKAKNPTDDSSFGNVDVIVRQAPRFIVQLPVWFTGDGEGGGMIYNISTNGCLIASKTPVETGRYLTLRLYVIDGKPPISVETAEVRWSKGQEFGLTFVSLNPEEQDRLFEYLNTAATA